jgi:predicted RND superfamily exporter protein
MSMMLYLALFMAVGIIGGVIYALVLLRKVLPDLPKLRERHGGAMAPLLLNLAVADYFRRDDPKERRTKIVLKILGFLWLLVCLVVLAVIVIAFLNADKINSETAGGDSSKVEEPEN